MPPRRCWFRCAAISAGSSLDCAPLSESPDGSALSRYADATLVVLEAEKTRISVAQRAIEELRMTGGNPAGVIINKRCLYIPNFIYRHL